MLAIHIDSGGDYKAVAAWAASKKHEKRMVTSAHQGMLEGATMYWAADDNLKALYKTAGVKSVSQSDVDKWLKKAESPAEDTEAE